MSVCSMDRDVVLVLQRVFYNAKDPAAAYSYVKPPEFTDEEWRAAKEGNRNEREFIPVVVHGFHSSQGDHGAKGLQDKVKSQHASVAALLQAAEV